MIATALCNVIYNNIVQLISLAWVGFFFGDGARSDDRFSNARRARACAGSPPTPAAMYTCDVSYHITSYLALYVLAAAARLVREGTPRAV